MPRCAASTSTRTPSTPLRPISFSPASIHIPRPLSSSICLSQLLIRYRIDKPVVDTAPYQNCCEGQGSGMERSHPHVRMGFACGAGHDRSENREAGMERQDHIELLKRLLHYVETGTTSLADA